MNRTLLLVAMIAVLMTPVFAQSEDLKKFEVAAEFTTLERDAISGQRTEPGFGGRFTYNLNRVFALEAAGYFFPKRCFQCRNNGRITEGLAGVKVGKRFENWGIFAKARPGVVSFSEGTFNVVDNPANPAFPIQFELNRLTTFATDIGGVIEFYPSKRIVTRFDAGDTIMHFRKRTTNTVIFDPITGVTGGISLVPITIPARTTHHFQFMTSVGFRF
jgi:hypothetical protein